MNTPSITAPSRRTARRTSTSLAIGASALAIALAAGTALGSCPDPDTFTIASPAASDNAGRSISYSTNGWLLVGVPFRNTSGLSNTGAAYLMARSGGSWVTRSEILADVPAASDQFGSGVAYSDPYAVIGAPGYGSAGAVYFFERTGATTWTQKNRTTPTSQAGSNVGSVLAIDGTTAAIGDPLRDLGPLQEYADAGAVYIYNRNASNGSWLPTQTIREDWTQESIADERLGTAVALSGDLLVVGVPQGEGLGWPTNHGYASVYRRVDGGAFEFEWRLVAQAPAANHHYGRAVATDGQLIAVGEPYHDRTAAEGGALDLTGCVHIHRYENGNWVHEAKIIPSDAQLEGTFGTAVELKNGRLIVAAAEAKKVYTFHRTGNGQWVQDEILTDPDDAANGWFGQAIAFNGNDIAVADPFDDLPGASNAGEIYNYLQPNFSHSDLCAGAAPIHNGTFRGCTDNANTEGYASCGGPIGTQGPDVWFVYTSACSGTLTVDTFGSSFDTILSVHTGCPGTPFASTIACGNDTLGHGPLSQVTFDYEPGRRYYIRLSGMNGAGGDYTLNVTDEDVPANNVCAGAEVITDGVYTFTNCRAGGGFPTVSGCGVDGGGSVSFRHDLWYRYTAPVTGEVTIDLSGSTFESVAAVYDLGHCPGLIDGAMACSAGGGSDGNARLQFAATEGVDYLIRVGSLTDTGGNGQMAIASTGNCPADWNTDGAVNSNDISAFLTTWLGSVQGGTTEADFDASGAVNSNDISAFLTAWLSAVQTGC